MTIIQNPQFNHPLPKIKVEILECDGGAGHKTCADAIEKVLRMHFQTQNREIEIVKTDIGTHLVPDALVKITFGKYKILDFYNWIAKNGYTGIIKNCMRTAQVVNKFYFNSQIKFFDSHYNNMDQKPDLIISVIPLLNGPLLKSAKKCGIPVLVTTTDADNALFSDKWPLDKDLAPYRYGIPYNTLEIAQKVHHAVDPANIRGIGYPVRAEFLKTYSFEEKEKIKQKLGINSAQKHVGIMMGGLGGVVTETYFQELLKAHKNNELDEDSHFSFFCGKNQHMIAKLIKMGEKSGFEKVPNYSGEGVKFIHPSSKLSITVLGFTKNVHEYMAVSHLWVTKPGSSSFNECLGMGVPMLIDNTSNPLPWEALNIELAETYNFGKKITKFNRFAQDLNHTLQAKNHEEYRQSIITFREERYTQKDFGRNIVKLTEELLSEASNVKENVEKAGILKDTQNTSKPAPIRSKLKGLGIKMLVTAKRIINVILRILNFIFIEPFRTLAKNIVSFAAFSGFRMDKSKKIKRRRELIHGIRHQSNGVKSFSPHKATPIEGAERPMTSPVSKRPIDALYIKSNSKNRTGNAIIYVLGKSYERFHPNNYDHLLEDGSDVVLFNPTQTTIKAMDADLKEIIKELKRRDPDQKLALHGYCIGAHVAGSVAADIAAGDVEGIKAESLPTIIDRGYGDGYEVGEKITSSAKIPFVRKYINQDYNVGTLEKIGRHKGAMLFLAPRDGDDQMLHRKIKKGKIHNFTKELFEKHHNAQWIELENADHWTPWTIEVHNQVKEFLHKNGIIGPAYTKISENNAYKIPKQTKVTWSRRNLMPLFV